MGDSVATRFRSPTGQIFPPTTATTEVVAELHRKKGHMHRQSRHKQSDKNNGTGRNNGTSNSGTGNVPHSGIGTNNGTGNVPHNGTSNVPFNCT